VESWQSGDMLHAGGNNVNADEKEKYSIAARLSTFNHKVERSISTIKKALQEHPENWMISYSSGKDSTVLLDLLISAGWRGIGFHCICSDYEDPPENQLQAEKARKMYGIDITDVHCYGEYDAWKEVGHLFCVPESAEETRTARRANTEFKKTSERFMKEHQISNIFMGLCKDESRARKINLRMRGQIYQTKSGRWTCCPLADWTACDIWAYIISRDLPYLHVYDIPHFSREKIRNELTLLYCDYITSHGVLLQYRMAYPELFAKLRKEFPGVGNYV
jgi:3'-phosphoadenosine 5'-phosphosulfate sulfotransferase (PAPS reductase)/FAD synthetase